MFKRKIYDDLKKWKEISNGSTAMLIEGARRVGKSTIAEEFGKNEYKSYILIDFSNVSDDVRTAFENGNPDLDTLFLKIRAFFNTELYERESLIIFDEVQFCPKARQRIKHLVKDGRYDYIETGSLISIKKNVKDILIPSDEESIEMNPMDFEEFLWACGNDTLVDSLRKIYAEDKPIESIIHKIAMENLRKYMIVGGMPEAVLAFTKDMTTFSNAEYVKKKTIKLYFDDCAKAPTSNENTTRILKAVPGMLSRHRKVFSPGVVKKGYSVDKLSNPIQWLKESKIVNTCESCDDPSAALGLTVNENRFKFYLADTGLLSTLAFGQDVIKKESFYNDIINDRLQMNKGMLIENLVAQMLKASGHELYFWEHRVDNKTYEVDFLLSDGKKVIPVEVKSGKRTSHTSLDVFVEKYQKRTNDGVIITPRLKDKVDNYRRVPLYMAMFL